MKLTELKLKPDAARVGTEIRVVGNDAGEKLSILSGVISRLDRNAPEYGDGYCDFNTNYIQAAAAASGGSSGSPVVNVQGYAIALQAGGRADGAATDYFLPLDRPLRSLEHIRRNDPVTRGTIQTQWLLKPFDECHRLGLTPEWEATVRQAAPKETGLLVAEIILPEGPADSKLQEGDVLLKVNGELLTQFVRLDDILDSSVGQTVQLLVQRGGQDIEVECQVGDLHAITPDRFVTVAGGTFHDLSYQQARLYAIAVRGVYLCEAAGSFRLENTISGWIIDTVDKRPTRNLNEFIEVMKTVPGENFFRLWPFVTTGFLGYRTDTITQIAPGLLLRIDTFEIFILEGRVLYILTATGIRKCAWRFETTTVVSGTSPILLNPSRPNLQFLGRPSSFNWMV